MKCRTLLDSPPTPPALPAPWWQYAVTAGVVWGGVTPARARVNARRSWKTEERSGFVSPPREQSNLLSWRRGDI